MRPRSACDLFADVSLTWSRPCSPPDAAAGSSDLGLFSPSNNNQTGCETHTTNTQTDKHTDKQINKQTNKKWCDANIFYFFLF